MFTASRGMPPVTVVGDELFIEPGREAVPEDERAAVVQEFIELAMASEVIDS